MTESIKKVNNPLTIIAIFAGLSEVAATVAVALLPHDLQQRIFRSAMNSASQRPWF